MGIGDFRFLTDSHTEIAHSRIDGIFQHIPNGDVAKAHFIPVINGAVTDFNGSRIMIHSVDVPFSGIESR